MMIQIDDSGWGSLVGGVLIGACRVETEEFGWEEIGVEFFQEPLFSQQAYLQEGARIATGLLDQLQVPRDEPIRVCTGHVLGGIREWLQREGFDWQTAKVGEPFQTLIEQALLEQLQKRGLKIDFEILTQKQGLAFYQAVAWLHGGYPKRPGSLALPEREKLCKTGWSTFRIWADHSYDEAKKLAREFKRRRSQERWQERR